MLSPVKVKDGGFALGNFAATNTGRIEATGASLLQPRVLDKNLGHFLVALPCNAGFL